jgi:sensor histidine kinase YesM
MVMNVKTRRILRHILFWLCVWAATAVVYGYDKQEFWMAIYTNLMFLPIHMFYFYFMAYFLIPKLLFTKKYFQFGFALVACVLLVPFLNRTVDIFVVEPVLSKYLEQRGFWWEKAQGTIWRRYSNPMYYFNALKGANLVVWAAIVIKFSKMWYERHHAALKAELAFLKGQIHPHFLFNTLNNLYSLTLNKSPKSPEIVLGLSDILRYMLYECNAEYVPLKKDIAVLEN